jgi:hypothetical protein
MVHPGRHKYIESIAPGFIPGKRINHTKTSGVLTPDHRMDFSPLIDGVKTP